MKAIILCGGQGTRLKEETEYKPKPMVQVGGKPILWHIMKIYAHYGIRDFVVALGFKGSVIKEYFLYYEHYNNDFTITLGNQKNIKVHGSSEEAKWKVTLVDTGEEAMTGARIKRCEKYITENDFMVTYGDGVANVDLKELQRYHKKHGKIGTMTGVNPPSRFGELVVNENQVTEFIEKPNLQVTKGSINGGFMVFKKAFFKYLSPDNDCVLERAPLENLARDKELMVHHHEGFWQCMDTYRDYTLLNQLWKDNPAWRVWRQ